MTKCAGLYTLRIMDTLSTIDDFAKKLLPLTYFRRNAGKVMAKLPKVGTFILTKDGKPVAKLSMLKDETKEENIEKNIAKLKSLAGGFKLGKGMSPAKINKLLDARYAEMLPR